MTARRIIWTWTVFLAVVACVGGTIGYGTYHRSDLYRRQLERELTAFFGLPVDVGAVRPHSFTTRSLSGLAVWLPDRRDRVFYSPFVLWGRHPEGEGSRIEVRGAEWTIGSEAWYPDDYTRVLRASLQHDFRQYNVREVHLADSRIIWPRTDFRLTIDDVAGAVRFHDDGTGQAALTCTVLNGRPANEPIRIDARLDPAAEEFLPEVRLTVPPLPLPTLGLDGLLTSRVTQGSFAGRITFRQLAGEDELQLAGRLADIRLEELTARLPGGAVSARVDLDVHEALVRGRKLALFDFRGDVCDLDVDALLAQQGMPRVGGRAKLHLHGGRVSAQGIEVLTASGEWLGASLPVVSQALLGEPSLPGRFDLRIHSLAVQDNELTSADLELTAVPPGSGPGVIPRSLLMEALDRLNVALPASLLPEQVEYVHAGARILADREQIRVLAGKGPAGPALVTVRLWGRDMPLMGNAHLTLDVAPLRQRIDPLLERLRTLVGD